MLLTVWIILLYMIFLCIIYLFYFFVGHISNCSIIESLILRTEIHSHCNVLSIVILMTYIYKLVIPKFLTINILIWWWDQLLTLHLWSSSREINKILLHLRNLLNKFSLLIFDLLLDLLELLHKLILSVVDPVLIFILKLVVLQ